MRINDNRNGTRVGVVGPCTSGKTTLIRNLREADGIELRHIAQEHSYVPSMWEKIGHPNYLIFLDVSFPVSQTRKRLNWTPADYQEQQRRLAHAREHADLYLNTDHLTPQEVVQEVRSFLQQIGLLDG